MITRYFQSRHSQGSHRVAYTEWGTAKTLQPSIICVHGLTRNGRDFDRLANVLAKDTALYCPDIVGRGQSDWLPQSSDYNYSQYIQDIAALLLTTQQKEVDWVGTSMGGILGMLLAALPESPIRRLVVNDVGPFISLSALQHILSYVAHPPDFATREEIEPYLRQTYASFGITREQDWQHMALHSARQKDDGRWTLAYDPTIADGLSALKEDVNFWESYDKIRCPILLLRGQNSDLLPSDVAHAMTRRGPRAKLIEIPGVGHAPALMDEQQIGWIKDFLRSS